MNTKTRLSHLLALLVIFLAFTPSGMADPIIIGETSRIFSKVLSEDRNLMISLPKSYRGSKTGYPVVYLLDAEDRFAHTTTTLAALARIGEVPEMIVVGLTNTQRTRDLTPAWTQGDPPEGLGNLGTVGGADNFLAFIKQELIPHVEAQYRTVPFRILIGHSFGGLFGVHALVSDPEVFQAILAISPSLWWDEGALVARATALFRERPDLTGQLFLTLGNEGEDMHANFKAMDTLLRYRAPRGLAWKAEILNDENHGSVPMASVDRGIKFFFSRWRVPPFALAEGLAAVDQHYANLAEQYGIGIATPERTINDLGYAALQAEGITRAIEIFRINVERYPGSANVYDSLGEALEQAGKIEEARKSYARAWEIGQQLGDPAAAIYKQHLDALSSSATSQAH